MVTLGKHRVDGILGFIIKSLERSLWSPRYVDWVVWLMSWSSAEVVVVGKLIDSREFCERFGEQNGAYSIQYEEWFSQKSCLRLVSNASWACGVQERGARLIICINTSQHQVLCIFISLSFFCIFFFFFRGCILATLCRKKQQHELAAPFPLQNC